MDVTFNPTPTNYHTITTNPTPNNYHAITRGPTPGKFGKITTNPTPVNFDAPHYPTPTEAPTYEVVEPTASPVEESSPTPTIMNIPAVVPFFEGTSAPTEEKIDAEWWWTKKTVSPTETPSVPPTEEPSGAVVTASPTKKGGHLLSENPTPTGKTRGSCEYRVNKN